MSDRSNNLQQTKGYFKMLSDRGNAEVQKSLYLLVDESKLFEECMYFQSLVVESVIRSAAPITDEAARLTEPGSLVYRLCGLLQATTAYASLMSGAS